MKQEIKLKIIVDTTIKIPINKVIGFLEDEGAEFLQELAEDTAEDIGIDGDVDLEVEKVEELK